jgi:hypothetical protein
MNRNSVGDAVDSLFVRCISSTNNIKAFSRAASLVRRLSSTPNHEHFTHLAVALEEQRHMLQMLRTNRNGQAREHAQRRDRELGAFYDAHTDCLDSFLLF